MSRNRYTVSFPKATPGDEVTWSNAVHVFADAQALRPLASAVLEEGESPSATLFSEAASVAFTCPRTGETLTCTTGAPSQTGGSPSAGGGGASEQSWIAANQNGNATLTSSETPVQWVVESSSATPPWRLNADGHTWECLVAGQYVIYAEPVLTYTVGDSSQGANVFVYLRPTLAADDALIYYPNNQWDYWFTPASTDRDAPGANNTHAQYYQSYSSVPAAFDVGDTFHIGAGVFVGTGNDSVTSNSAHTIAIVKIG